MMLVLYIKNDKIRTINLPNKYYGVYWVTDINNEGEEINLISISSDNNSWCLNSNSDMVIMQNNMELSSVNLQDYNFYYIYNKIEKRMNLLYCMPTYDKTFEMYYIATKSINIGNTADCAVSINMTRGRQFMISLLFDGENNFKISSSSQDDEVYVNNERLIGEKVLKPGDKIFILGVTIIAMKENDKPFIVINNPNGSVKIDNSKLSKIERDNFESNISNIVDEDAILYSEQDYFHKKPRFKEVPNILDITLDAPPEKQDSSEMPAILVVGPMVTSGSISAIYAYITINNLVQNKQSFGTAWPSFLICIFSLMTTLFWPLIIRKYNKHKYKKMEKIRKTRYEEYVKNVMNQVSENANLQKRILINNNPSYEECKKAIEERNINFWNRKPDDEDFLNISLGYGTLPMNIKLNVPEIHFKVEKDELLENISKIKNELPFLNDVPINYNFLEKRVTAIIGNYELNKKFADNIIFELATFHSYDDLKLVILTNEINQKNNNWDFAKVLPHCWSNDKSIRFLGSNKDEIREIGYYLDSILNFRMNSNHENKKNIHIPYYLIITDDYKLVRNFEFIKKVTNTELNLGMGLLILNNKVFNLPAECDNFINVNEGTSELFQNVLNSEILKFKFDYTQNIELEKYSKIMANIPIENNGSDNNDNNMPEKIGFLELYDVGKIEQLNVLNRWRESNPMLSLQALIGIGKGGEKIYLDLHEKYHGPHGLIAGMTGSGKSEFIATYILSLAINYHPYEVQFILIDYKGGGLAGIFENKVTGVKIPHLIGTITNLDENEILRSLASIESEVKRRQVIFQQVREKISDSVIDIYKYQQLYRDGVVSEPVSHLFIICDEFAELKTQQPEFLQQLISISRIGRSLGIHLILATQKPSGVVDNQIWSNSKFRVCLRVQEKADSTEVIKCSDAAYLKNTGRFYLQVGYNEVFTLGQAAWAGCNYIPSEKVKRKIDTTVEFVNNIGYRIKKIETNVKDEKTINYGEEAKNIIYYLNNLSLEENIQNKNLWLDKIPAYININDIKHKYNFVRKPYVLDIPIGEYDIPSSQTQSLLTIPFAREGNVLVYGSAGSGKENLITTMLYSMITSYTPNEVISYILDFGSGMLKIFNNIPHIGDIIEADNQEKIDNLFKLLFFMLDERKKLFADYNGDYNTYSLKSEDKIPSVVVVLNNYDSYIENYPNYEDSLIQLTREGSKYGIYFIFTIINANVLRLKISQNFRQIFVLQQNNVADYSNILGNVNKKYPSKLFGRGIVKYEDIYEFQTAFVSEPLQISNYIEQMKPILNQTSVKAIEIPVLPDIVDKKSILQQLNKDGSIVIGIAKESLNIVKYDLKNYYTNLFLTYDISLISHFIKPFVEQTKDSEYYDIMIFDVERICEDISGINYYNQNIDSIFEQLYRYVMDNNKLYTENGSKLIRQNGSKKILCIIIGFDAFKNRLSIQNQSKIGELLEKGKDLELINYIFVDSADKMMKYEYESWYKTVVNNNRGIFIGNGISDQMVIKLLKNDLSLRAEINNSFCYVINYGRALLTKYVEDFDNNEKL